MLRQASEEGVEGIEAGNMRIFPLKRTFFIGNLIEPLKMSFCEFVRIIFRNLNFSYKNSVTVRATSYLYNFRSFSFSMLFHGRNILMAISKKMSKRKFFEQIFFKD